MRTKVAPAPALHPGIFLILFVLTSLLCGACSRPPPPKSAAAWPQLAAGEQAVLFTGDVFLGAQVTAVMEKKGSGWHTAELGPVITAARASAVIGNHEGVIGTSTRKTGPNRWNYLARPGTGQVLAEAGWTHLGISNNHALDRGRRGMLETRKDLENAGIVTFAGGTEIEASAPLILQVGDTRLAVIAAMNPWPQYRRAGWRAEGEKTGIALLQEAWLVKVIQEAREEADVVVLYPHWGAEYKGVVSHQRKWAQRAVELGVDAIIGHHSHEAQPIRFDGAVPVAWSLGNAAFGTDGRFKRGQGHGLLLRMVLSRGAIVRLDFMGIHVDNKKNGFQPRPLEDLKSVELLRALSATQELGWSFQGAVGSLPIGAESPPPRP